MCPNSAPSSSVPAFVDRPCDVVVDQSAIEHLLTAAAAEDRYCLLEHEVYEVLQAMGCSVPSFVFVAATQAPDGKPQQVTPDQLASLQTATVIVKVVSPLIAHKTDVGGVAFAPADAAEVSATITRMLSQIPERFVQWLKAHPALMPQQFTSASAEQIKQAVAASIRGFIVAQKVSLQNEGPGSEVLVGLRHNREFGPVITIGVGGVDTELFGEACYPGKAVVTGSADRNSAGQFLRAMTSTLAYQRVAGLTRGGKRLVQDEQIHRVIEGFRCLGNMLGTDEIDGEGWTITELEVNPFGVSNGKLVALDGLLKFRRRRVISKPRPHGSIDALLHPESIGFVGVSSKGMNMGRIILRNVLEVGFDPKRMYIVREGIDEIDGVQCVPRIADLPERVDAFVLGVNAAQVPDIIEQLAELDKAVGVIVIAGGLGEKVGGDSLEVRVKNTIAKARSEGKPLVINGGNCLGLVSRPGKYHTLFIPQHKLPLATGGRDNVAFLSQSGAYMISRLSKMSWLSPRYATSTGNQTDLSVADYLAFLADDQHLQTLAVYAEGFGDGDGLWLARATQKAVAAGKDVVFYKAGRTTEGKSATSGHTASLAGEYEVCASIMRDAGALVAPSFQDFLNLVKISSMLGNKNWSGNRLAAMSNAGYEAVGIADSVRGAGWNLVLADPTQDTKKRLVQALSDSKLDSLVDVRNPFDITPMAGDKAHEDVVRAFVEDENVDLVLCATVPLTPAMASLAVDPDPNWTLASPGSVPNRLGPLVAQTKKPVVGCVDSGTLYDPLVQMLDDKGIPTFRSADEAMRAMGLYLESRLRRG